MKIFIDANVIIDYLVDRMPFADDAEMAERRQQSMTSAQFVDGMIESVENLARLLQEGYAVPKTETTDAAHIATAAIYGMDVLLTWNCKHIANAVTMPKIYKVCHDAGYQCPLICTPEQMKGE